MTADLIRRAAAMIRHDATFDPSGRHEFLLAVADWLEYMGDDLNGDCCVNGCESCADIRSATEVARAYLGADA